MPINTDKGLRHFKPLTIDFYILSEVLTPFLGGIVFFLFIFLMFQALRLAEFFIVHGVGGGILLKLTGLMVMTFIPTALPIAFLIAVLMGYGRLSSDSELVAMKANGFSLFRLATPVLVMALAVVSLSAMLNLEWVPWSQRNFKTTLVKVSNTKIVSSINEGTFTPGFFDLLLFADKVDTKTNRLTHVFIYDETDPKNPRVVVAKTGEIIPVKTKEDLSAAAVLNLFNGSIHRNDEVENTYQLMNFSEYRDFLKIDEGADTTVLKPEFLSLHELRTRIRATDDKTYAGREWRGEFWRRITIAVTPILFVFLGIGFGTVRTRAVRAGALLVAIVTLTLYYGLQVTSMMALQRILVIPPWAIMELPNFGILLGAIYGFRKASW
jgi:lipopolysaccharide export system permease protein